MQIPIIWRRGQAKPWPSIPLINWAHPLAQGLVSYNYDLSGGVLFDLVTGVFATQSTGTANRIANQSSPFGTGTKYAGVSGASDGMQGGVNTRAGRLTSVAPYSIATSFLQTGAPVSGNAMVSIYDLANVGLFSVNAATGNQLQINVNTDSFFTGTAQNSQNVFHTVLASIPNTTSANVYCDGTLNSARTAITSTRATTTAQVIINEVFLNNAAGAGAGSGGINGFVYYVAQWTRALTAAEANQLHFDPFCFLVYPEDDIFAELVGSSVVPPGPGPNFLTSLMPMMGVG